jgi:hypothetical protein
MPRRISFTTADKVGKIRLDPTLRLTLLSDERKHELTGHLNPLDEQARQQQMLSFVNGSILKLDDGALLLTRIGAYVVLFAQIESRIRAMYRQRHAMMYGLPAPTTSEEDSEDADTSVAHLDQRVETIDLKRVSLMLYKYEDMDKETVTEVLDCIEIRNKLIHQALYRTAAYKIDLLPILYELFNHLVRVRNRMTTRLNKERSLYPDTQHVQAVVRQRLADIPIGQSILRTELFARLAGSIDLNVPVTAGQPLYLVAKPAQQNSELSVTVAEEQSHHDLWHTMMASQQPYVVFQKQRGTHVESVIRLGEGLITRAEYTPYGHPKTLYLRLQQ